MGGLREEDPNAARVQLRVAARSAEGSLGHHHPETARALVALGSEAAADGRLDEAEVALRRAVAILQTQPDADRQAVAGALRELGELFLRTGRDGDARHALRWSLRLYEEALGVDHPTVDAVRTLAEP